MNIPCIEPVDTEQVEAAVAVVVDVVAGLVVVEVVGLNNCSASELVPAGLQQD